MALAAILVLSALAQAAPPPPPVYVPERVYDTRQKVFIDFEVMLATLATADVVFVGEQHDDPNTHRLEAAILDGLQRRRGSPAVSLEMFERDVQPLLDAYLAGTMAEEEAMKSARPWPRYATDYRPLVERAKAQGWPVIAANVPRRIASLVAKSGQASLDALSETDRGFVARELQCPLDAYFERFTKQMGSHPGANQTPEEQRATLERYYWSQCVKDETMAESIAAAAARGLVVHYNGSFHSDYGLGAAERTRRRLPGKRVVVISVLPVPDLDVVKPNEEDLRRADYLLYTVR